MSKAESTMLPLGTFLPSFVLPVVNGTKKIDQSQNLTYRKLSSEIFKKKPLLIMLICAHCPFVKHVENEITNLQNDYENIIDLLAVSSNSLKTHPQDAPIYLEKQAKENGWRFPYLFDSDQELAKALQASCTPDFFLFSPSDQADLRLAYRGQLDNSRPSNKIPVNGNDLRAAINAVVQLKDIPMEQKPSIGCNIKWHPGQEPYWFI